MLATRLGAEERVDVEENYATLPEPVGTRLRQLERRFVLGSVALEERVVKDAARVRTSPSLPRELEDLFEGHVHPRTLAARRASSGWGPRM